MNKQKSRYSMKQFLCGQFKFPLIIISRAILGAASATKMCHWLKLLTFFPTTSLKISASSGITSSSESSAAASSSSCVSSQGSPMQAESTPVTLILLIDDSLASDALARRELPNFSKNSPSL